jgi:mono/diheme cytochrome c family protein
MKFHTDPFRSLLLASALLGCLPVHAQTASSPSRGQLLYTTHCISCHTTQMHWRDDRLAWNWDTLKTQVRRWQGNAGLQWGDADIAEVARHLNDSIYHFPQINAGRVVQ